MIAEVFKLSLLGIRFNNVFCVGTQLAIKFVDAEERIIKNKTITVNSELLIFPMISVGFVKILSMFSKFLFRKISAPITIKTAKKENIIKFKTKLKY